MAMKTLPELLRTPLPDLEYGAGVTLPAPNWDASSAAVHPPGGYHPWSGFFEAVMDLASAAEASAASFHPPVPFPGRIWSDRGVRSLLYTYWTTPIAQLSEQALKQPLGLGPPDCVPSLIGKPDFVVFPEVPAVEQPESCHLVVIARSSRTSGVDPRLSAAQLCELRQPLVCRMFGYLSANFLYRRHRAPQLGVVTMYESSWFCCLSGDALLVSDPVRAADTSPGVLACLWYVLNLAVKEGSSSAAPPPPALPPPRELKPATSALVAGCSASFRLPDRYLRVMDYEEVALENRIHIGNSSLVYESRYQDMDAVIKCLDVSQCGTEKLAAFLHEVHTYESGLKELQGIAIPRLLDAGFLHGGMFYLLVLSDEGDTAESLDALERRFYPLMGARSALEKIHGLGFVHGDVSLSNVCCARGRSARWLDLEGTRQGTQQEMRDELDRLDDVFSASGL